jgi:ribokinase
MTKIMVIGSSSMDLVVTAPKRPLAGETLLGDSFKTVPGGKGANQAVAASRLGAEVYMVGCVGTDRYGEEIVKNLQQNGVNTDFVEVINGESGTAHIVIAEDDNSIIVVQGANRHVTPELVSRAGEVLSESDMVLIQQEIPVETVRYVSRLCKKLNVPLMLNPAPARKTEQEVIEAARFLTPNEHEASLLFDGMGIQEAIRKYPGKLFVTQGMQGVRYFDGKKEVVVPSYPVTVVDTTGAGDTFNAAFAVALSEGKGIEKSLQFANKAASISVSKFGAQGGMPTREEVGNG